jgi:hypothetical protein
MTASRRTNQRLARPSSRETSHRSRAARGVTGAAHFALMLPRLSTKSEKTWRRKTSAGWVRIGTTTRTRRAQSQDPYRQEGAGSQARTPEARAREALVPAGRAAPQKFLNPRSGPAMAAHHASTRNVSQRFTPKVPTRSRSSNSCVRGAELRVEESHKHRHAHCIVGYDASRFERRRKVT